MALYNLRTDPGETEDVQLQHTDVVKQLEALGDEYRRQLGDDLTNTPCTECRPSAIISK